MRFLCSSMTLGMRLGDGRVVPNFIQQALRGEPLTIYGTGKQTRSFCYVSDLIEGIYRLMMTDEHMPVNIGNPNETSIRDFALVINDLCQNPGGIIEHYADTLGDDPQRRQPDVTRAKSILGWEPKVDLRDGLCQTIEYMRKKIDPQAG